MHRHAEFLRDLMEDYFSGQEYDAAGLEQPPPLVGKGFFPACNGTWDSPKNEAHQPLLFLGHDFGVGLGPTEKRETNAVPTWRHLESLMSDAGIDARSCFFTNAVMGVRPEKQNSVGRSPAFDHPVFVGKCAAFILSQLSVVKPAGVVVLGLPALEVLRMAGWGNLPEASSFEVWDQGKEPKLFDAQLAEWKGPLALIVHPSFRPLNVGLRSKSGDKAEGHAHEVRLLKSLISRPEITGGQRPPTGAK